MYDTIFVIFEKIVSCNKLTKFIQIDILTDCEYKVIG